MPGVLADTLRASARTRRSLPFAAWFGSALRAAEPGCFTCHGGRQACGLPSPAQVSAALGNYIQYGASMHPNAYLRTYWRSEFRPRDFCRHEFCGRLRVSVQGSHRASYHCDHIPRETIACEPRGPFNALETQSFPTSLMVLPMPRWSWRTCPPSATTRSRASVYRSGNVMYEVGVALACRQSSEVLLIRDDQERFLFDVSTIPHKHIDFSDANPCKATTGRRTRCSRLNERDHLQDARIAIAVAGLTAEERRILSVFAPYQPGEAVPCATNQPRNIGSLATAAR